MEHLRKLIQDRLLDIEPEAKKKDAYMFEPKLVEEYHELLRVLNNFYLLQIVINATSQAHQQGYGDGLNEAWHKLTRNQNAKVNTPKDGVCFRADAVVRALTK
jgi:hypothetical protein